MIDRPLLRVAAYGAWVEASMSGQRYDDIWDRVVDAVLAVLAAQASIQAISEPAP